MSNEKSKCFGEMIKCGSCPTPFCNGCFNRCPNCSPQDTAEKEQICSKQEKCSSQESEPWWGEFRDKWLTPAEKSYRIAVSDQVAPYRQNLDNLLDIRDFIKSLLSQATEEAVRGERARIMEGITKIRVIGISVMKEAGSEFTTPRMNKAIGYDNALTDAIDIVNNYEKRI